MVKFLYLLAKEIRVRQWLKNLVLFSAIVFTGQLFNSQLFFTTIKAIVVFCLISSAIYLINDIIDIPKDRLHPFKRFRPLAAGLISIPTALTLIVAFLILGLGSAFLFFPKPFFLVTIIFVLLELAYTFYLKHIELLDVIIIAGAFILRVFAGEAATGFHINIWLFLTVVSVSLFMAIGKRRGELTLLLGSHQTRHTLSHYSEKMLDVYLSIFATATWMSYTFYTFLEKPPVLRTTLGNFFEDNLPIFSERKWLMLSIPFVIYGIMRYLQLIYEKREGESPEKILLSDRPLIIAIVLWGLVILGVIYIIGR